MYLYSSLHFSFSLFFLPFSLQRSESACFEYHKQTGFHYCSESWLCPGQHPSCWLETTFCECQRSNQWGRALNKPVQLAMSNAGLLILCYTHTLFMWAFFWCVCVYKNSSYSLFPMALFFLKSHFCLILSSVDSLRSTFWVVNQWLSFTSIANGHLVEICLDLVHMGLWDSLSSEVAFEKTLGEVI